MPHLVQQPEAVEQPDRVQHLLVRLAGHRTVDVVVEALEVDHRAVGDRSERPPGGLVGEPVRVDEAVVRRASGGSAFTAVNRACRNSGCIVASPPDTVMPLRNGAARRMAGSSVADGRCGSGRRWRSGSCAGCGRRRSRSCSPAGTRRIGCPGPSTQLKVTVSATARRWARCRAGEGACGRGSSRRALVAADALHRSLGEVVRVLAAGREVVAAVAGAVPSATCTRSLLRTR
jgi:hypothetical protein